MSKQLKIALFLSVILPLGLLTTLRLGGVLKEPLTISENKTLDAVSWSTERPAAIINIKDSVVYTYHNGDISANFMVFIDDYHENSWAYGGSDYLAAQFNITASVSEGFINLVNITFWEDYENSQVDFFGDEAWPNMYAHVYNLSIIRHDDFFVGEGLKAMVELAGVKSPKGVSFGFFANWILRSQQSYTHQLEVRFELTYFNGTIYKRIAQPFLLKIGPDDNNSFENAETILKGTYSRLYIGPNDVNDYYKVYLNEGHTVNIHLERLGSPVANCDLELYNPNGELAISSTHNYTHTITYPINSSGYWFIRVHWLAGFGFYTLTLETAPQGGD